MDLNYVWSSLEEEIMYLLEHQPFGERISRFIIRDFIQETRGFDYSDEEIEQAIIDIERCYGTSFPQGSLAEDIKSISAYEMKTELLLSNHFGASALTKVDELEMQASGILRN